MKISRVSETCSVPEQNRNSRQYSRHEFSLRIEPLLERDGDTSADADQHDQHEAPEGEVWFHVVGETVPTPDDKDARADDSLDAFLERIRRAHRLDLRM